MLTSAPATEALTFASSVDLDVACGVDLTLDCPAEKNVAVDVQLADQAVAWSERDRAGAMAWGWRFGRRLIAVDLGTLAPGALVLEVAHADMAVEAGAVFDLEPANCYVPLRFAFFAQDQLVPGCEGTFDVTLDRDVRRLEVRLDLCARRDIDVASHMELAFGAPVHVHMALIPSACPSRLSFGPIVNFRSPSRLESWSWAAPIGVLFCDCLLYVHELESPPLGLKPGKHRTRTPQVTAGRDLAAA